MSLDEAVKTEAAEGRELRLVSLDDRVVLLSPPNVGSSYALPVLREGRTALGFKSGWVTIYRPEGAAELQRHAHAIVDAFGGGRAKRAQASYVLSRDDYVDLYEAARDVAGRWNASFTVQDGFVVSDLVDTPEQLPQEMTRLEVGFDVELPVVGRTYVAVNAEREAGGRFRYRLRFYEDFDYDDYEREEWPDIREQRPSETPEGRRLPFLRELEDEALADAPERGGIASAEGLAMLALFRLWGDGRDLIDYDYEE